MALSPWFFSSLNGVHWSWGASTEPTLCPHSMGCAVPPALLLVQPPGALPEGTGVSG